jgi:hypothetical protein
MFSPFYSSSAPSTQLYPALPRVNPNVQVCPPLYSTLPRIFKFNPVYPSLTKIPSQFYPSLAKIFKFASMYPSLSKILMFRSLCPIVTEMFPPCLTVPRFTWDIPTLPHCTQLYQKYSSENITVFASLFLCLLLYLLSLTVCLPFRFRFRV